MDLSCGSTLLHGDEEVFLGKIEQDISSREHMSPFTVTSECLFYDVSVERKMHEDKHRLIFYNSIITEEEERYLERYSEYIEKNCDKEKQAKLKVMRREYLRFLYSSDFNFKKATELVLGNYEFRHELHISPAKESEVIKYLKAGLMYWHGRDKEYRPILIIQLKKLDKIEHNMLMKLLIYCFEYFLRYLVIAGRVENWIVIVDCIDKSVNTFPMNTIKLLIETLNVRYRSRLAKMIVLNAPVLLNMISKPIIASLSSKTNKKIRLLSSSFTDELYKYISPEQLEKKYGGNNPDLQPGKYYPFTFFPNSKHDKPIDTRLVEKPGFRLIHTGKDLSEVQPCECRIVTQKEIVSENCCFEYETRIKLLRNLNLSPEAAKWVTSRFKQEFTPISDLQSLTELVVKSKRRMKPPVQYHSSTSTSTITQNTKNKLNLSQSLDDDIICRTQQMKFVAQTPHISNSLKKIPKSTFPEKQKQNDTNKIRQCRSISTKILAHNNQNQIMKKWCNKHSFEN